MEEEAARRRRRSAVAPHSGSPHTSQAPATAVFSLSCARATHNNHLRRRIVAAVNAAVAMDLLCNNTVEERRQSTSPPRDVLCRSLVCSEAGGGAARPTRKDGRTPPRYDESERGGARGVHD